MSLSSQRCDELTPSATIFRLLKVSPVFLVIGLLRLRRKTTHIGAVGTCLEENELLALTQVVVVCAGKNNTTTTSVEYLSFRIWLAMLHHPEFTGMEHSQASPLRSVSSDLSPLRPLGARVEVIVTPFICLG